MKVSPIDVDVDVALVADTLKKRSTGKRVRTPNCTHVSMERVFLGEDGHCEVCGRVPAMGFLYECRQDWDYDPLSPTSHTDSETSGQPKSPLRRDLEMFGLSESVIATADEGKYSAGQLEKLKELKKELNQCVWAANRGGQFDKSAER